MSDDRLTQLLAVCDAEKSSAHVNGCRYPGDPNGNEWHGVIELYPPGCSTYSREESLAAARRYADMRNALPDALKALVKCREALRYGEWEDCDDPDCPVCQSISEALAAIEQVGGGEDADA